MRATGEGAEHAGGIGCVLRLVEDLAVEDNRCIRPEDGGFGMGGLESTRLFYR